MILALVSPPFALVCQSDGLFPFLRTVRRQHLRHNLLMDTLGSQTALVKLPQLRRTIVKSLWKAMGCTILPPLVHLVQKEVVSEHHLLRPTVIAGNLVPVLERSISDRRSFGARIEMCSASEIT